MIIEDIRTPGGENVASLPNDETLESEYDLITPVLVSGQETQNQSDAQWKPLKQQGALSRNPETTDLQTPLGFRFLLRRSPNITFFVNKINVPGVSLPAALQPTQKLIIPLPGDHIAFEPLILTFRVDEGMGNYFELSEWVKAVSSFNPEEFAKLAANPQWSGYGLTSEILVTVLNAQKNVVRVITYHEAWPTQLSTLQFDVSLKTVGYVPATAVFYYHHYTTSKDV